MRITEVNPYRRARRGLMTKIRRLRHFGFDMTRCVSICGSILILLCISADVFSQTSTFTYQGKLTEGTTAANGTHQMQFSLYDAVSGGTQIGATITNNNVAVTDGVFTVQLDFAPATPFTSGADRWLEVAVKKPADPTFTPLHPRQRITSSPYSLKTISASTADSLSANCVSCVTDGQVSNTISIGSAGSVNDGALSANVAHLNVAETISGNWINTANPWADNEVADNLSINNGIIDNTAIGFNGPAAGAFTTLTATNFTGSGTTTANVVSAATQYNIGASPVLRVSGLSTFVGIATGPSNTGSDNSFFGRSAGFANTSGNQNSFFGTGAGQANTAGSTNTFFGVQAGSANTIANNNSFFGAFAGQSTTGGGNNFFGKSAGQNNTIGVANAFFGGGQSNTTGGGNSFFGSGAGFANTTAGQNSFFGANAGASNTTGGSQTSLLRGNSYFGYNAGFSSTTANSNSFFGHSAGYSSTGDFNTAVGSAAGYDNITGTKNTFIGYQANSPFNSGLTYATAIGADSRVSSSNTIVLGRPGGEDNVHIPGNLMIGRIGSGASHVCVSSEVPFVGYLSFCSSSLRYKTNIAPFREGLRLVNQLRPIYFDWKASGLRDVGFGAEDVAAINPLFVTYNQDGKIEGVKYDVLSVAFVNAFKEQQAQIEAQQKQINELRRIVCALKPDAPACQKEEQ